jgi:hypothetical protein
MARRQYDNLLAPDIEEWGGLTSTAMEVAWGTVSRHNPNRFASSLEVNW